MSLERRVSLPTLAAFGAGSIAEGAKNIALELFLLFYYTQVLGLPGSLTGLALAIAMIADAISDSYVGVWSDNLRNARWGRRHTLMIAAVLPFCASLYALFAPPASLSTAGLLTWLTVFAILVRTFITFFAIPHFAVGVELTRERTQRPRVVAARNIGSTLSRVVLPLVAFQWFFVASAQFPQGQLNPAHYPKFALAFALLSAVFMVICIQGTLKPIRESEARETPAPPIRPTPIAVVREVMHAFRTTPNIRWNFAMALMVFVTLTSLTTLKNHLMVFLWQVPPAYSGMVAAATSIGTLGGALLLLLVGDFDRRRVVMGGIFLFGAINALTVLLPIWGLMPAAGTSALAWAVIALLALSGLIYGAYLVAVGSMAADISDEHEANTGKPQQGLVQGFNFFAIKLASGGMTLLAGVFLDLIDFPRGKGVTAADVPLEKVHALAYFVAAFALLGVCLVIFAVSRIQLSAAKQRSINERLAARRSA